MRFAAHCGQSPAQSGAAEHLHGHAQRERVARPRGEIEDLILDVGAGELLPAPRSVDLARVDLDRRRRRREAAHARSRERRGEAQSQRVPVADHPRDFELHRDARRLGGVVLAAELERLDRDLQLEAAALAGGEAQAGEIEGVGLGGHVLSG